MNNKGFTLVELLATIIILSLITSITVVTVTSIYSNSKDKAEEVFKQELANIITDYITIYNNKFNFSCNASTGICTATTYKNSVKINGHNRSSSDNIKLKDLVDSGLISNNDVINPKDKDADCKINEVTITVYRNNNYVYRFETNDINCLTGANKKIKTDFPS